MSDFPYIGGIDIADIENKEFLRLETDKAKEIVIALDKSGIPFSARFGDSEMVLTYDGSYQEQVEDIITKSHSGQYEEMLRELKEYGMPDSYFRLLGEVAEVMNTTVSDLQSSPKDIQLMLCKTYADFWHCDNSTIRRELGRITTVNGRTLSDIQEYEKEKTPEKYPKEPEQNTDVPTFQQLFADYQKREQEYRGFTREKHKILADIARRRQSDEHERTVQTEELERRKRP